MHPSPYALACITGCQGRDASDVLLALAQATRITLRLRPTSAVTLCRHPPPSPSRHKQVIEPCPARRRSSHRHAEESGSDGGDVTPTVFSMPVVAALPGHLANFTPDFITPAGGRCWHVVFSPPPPSPSSFMLDHASARLRAMKHGRPFQRSALNSTSTRSRTILEPVARSWLASNVLARHGQDEKASSENWTVRGVRETGAGAYSTRREPVGRDEMVKVEQTTGDS
ncbi:hypothetical protein RJ55_02812 [Drechmeria coniospora]|nr:hypothetical protein RJ55_02812 [Drechmeria coniospora]